MSFLVETTGPQNKRATKEYIEQRSGVRNRDYRIQVQSWRKMELAAQDRTGWRK